MVAVAGSSAGVLARARAARAAVMAAEVALLEAAVEWAAMHEPADPADAACWWERGEMISLAGEGVPLVADYAVAEFAAAVGRSTDQGRLLIGQALELAWRLPATWAQVRAGQVPAWRARRVAGRTQRVSRAAARMVDRQIAAVAGRVSLPQLDQLVVEAERRAAGLAPFPDADETTTDSRRVVIDHRQISFEGTVGFYGELDLADALDLDQALATGAEALKTAGSTDPLPARRAAALGELARRYLAHSDVASPEPTTPRRPVTLYLHLTDTDLTHPDRTGQVGRCQNTGTAIDVEQIRAWCNAPGTSVTITPIIDLNDTVRVDQYEIPDRIAERIELRDGSCVFPHCTRPATTCDTDHITPYAHDGPTSTDNLAPLCRHHHRLKTHTPWTYQMTEPGTYLWTSPHHHTYRRDHTGTTDLTKPP
ncbi:MAG: HNH endonuclease signature motif containing protein [Nocardioides sp.]